MSDPRLYCARYGLPRRVLLIMAGLAGFVLIAVFVPGPGFGRAAAGGFFGVCLVGMTAMWLIVQQAGRMRMSYVGLKGWTSLQDPGAGGPTRQKFGAALVPHVDADVVTASRPVNFWKLDRELLAAAIRANVPHVPLQVVER